MNLIRCQLNEILRTKLIAGLLWTFAIIEIEFCYVVRNQEIYEARIILDLSDASHVQICNQKTQTVHSPGFHVALT